ncbi:PH domain-containing protein [Nocardioides conyzicola]|uniref:PH domain-containing protein n=1 Tax=Nocardioides conyzicola TaxID=1651781 RepID=A0ABP8WRL7_9ACTN
MPELREPSQRVSPRARLMWGTAALLESVVVLVILWVVGPENDWVPLPLWGVVAVGVVAAAYVVGMPPWRYRVHRWEVTDTAVYTQTGWWVRERRIAPMSRIQTVDHAEGLLAQVFGLATVTVTTASAAGALEIAGLERGRALALVEQLTVQADTVSGDAT